MITTIGLNKTNSKNKGFRSKIIPNLLYSYLLELKMKVLNKLGFLLFSNIICQRTSKKQLRYY